MFEGQSYVSHSMLGLLIDLDVSGMTTTIDVVVKRRDTQPILASVRSMFKDLLGSDHGFIIIQVLIFLVCNTLNSFADKSIYLLYSRVCDKQK